MRYLFMYLPFYALLSIACSVYYINDPFGLHTLMGTFTCLLSLHFLCGVLAQKLFPLPQNLCKRGPLIGLGLCFSWLVLPHFFFRFWFLPENHSWQTETTRTLSSMLFVTQKHLLQLSEGEMQIVPFFSTYSLSVVGTSLLWTLAFLAGIHMTRYLTKEKE